MPESSLLDLADKLEQNGTLLNPITNLPVKTNQQLQQDNSYYSLSNKLNPVSKETPLPQFSESELNSYEKRDIRLPIGESITPINDMRANSQSTFDTFGNALGKFIGKTAITVADTILGGLYSIPDAIINGDMSKLYDNDFHRAMDKASNWMENIMPIYETKAQSEEGFWSKLNNAKFWGDGVMGGLSFSVGAVLSEMALSAITASTFGAAEPIQAAETASLMSRAKKIFSLFGKDATSAELKALGKDVTKSLVVGAGYEAGVEARNFLDTARKNYIDQYKQQYGTEPDNVSLSKADEEIKKTANMIFGANMALLSVDNFIQFKNIFGKGLSTDLKLFGKGAVKTEGEDLAKDFALRGALETAYESVPLWKKTLYTVPKVLKNPLTEGFEEGTQNLFQSIGQDYIKKKYDALGYDDSFNIITSFNKNFKDAYASEDAGIGFIIGALGIPGMGIVSGKFKKAEGFKNKVLASFEGGIFEAFEEQSQEKQAIKSAIKQASSVNIDNLKQQLQENSVLYKTTQERDEALRNGDFFSAKNAESDALFSFIKSRDNVGLINQSQEQYANMIKTMDNQEFAKQFGYDNLNNNERALTDDELTERKKKVVDAFNNKVKNFQETKDLASKVAPVRNFNDEDARLYNEAIHHLMYTTNDLDNREDELIKSVKDKMSKTKDIDEERVKEIMNWHNTWFNITQGQYSKHLQGYLKDLALMDTIKVKQHPLTEEDSYYKSLQDKKDKIQKRIDDYEKSFQEELDKINKSKDKLGNYGFNIDYNFKDMDSFKNAALDYDNFRKDIENHINQNIFDKLDLNQSIGDLQKIQNKKHKLIRTYNVLNTKNGRDEFNKKVKNFEREFKINYLKIQASKFLHNQGLELNKETEREIEKNVDLQIDEDDSQIVKELKTNIKNISDKADEIEDTQQLKELVQELKDIKDNDKVDSKLSKIIDSNIRDIQNKIKDINHELTNQRKDEENNKKQPVFYDIKNLFRLANSDEQQSYLNDVVTSFDDNQSYSQKEQEFRNNITFFFEIIENPISLEEQKSTNSNENVKILPGIRNTNNSVFNFKMLYKGEELGGFTMPNQIYIKNKDNWEGIDFSKLDNDNYLQWLLPHLFPQDIISTKEDRTKIGEYLQELNNFSNKLVVYADSNQELSFTDLDNKIGGLLSDNAFTSQISMNITPDNTSRSIENILDDKDNLITKSAVKNVDGQDIVLFGKSMKGGQGYSKKYFVRIIDGKLERNGDKVIWNEVDGSVLQNKINELFKDKDGKDKTKNVNTKNSLFSLLVFQPNGFIQPLFTTNEKIGELQGTDKDNEFITKFLKNKDNIQPLTNILSDELKDFMSRNGGKLSTQIEKTDTRYINDIFFTIKGSDDSNVKITPLISTNGELSFQVENKSNRSKSFVNTYIYFNGTNFVKINTKGDENAKTIFNDYNEGKITLSEKIEKLEPYSEIINNLNEVIGNLLLNGRQLTNEEFENNDRQYTVLNAVRQATKNNNSEILGFYNDILLSADNQQDLENLQIKQKLNYFLYLRPGNSKFLDIYNFSKDIRDRATIAQKQKEQDEISKLLSENKTTQKEQVEKQEEAKTIKELVTPIQTTQDEVPKGLENVFGYNQGDIFESLDKDILKQAFDEVGLPFNMLAKIFFEKNKDAIMAVYNQKSQAIPLQTQEESKVISLQNNIEAKIADIERERQEKLDNLFSQTQASTDKELNTPVDKLSKEEIGANIEKAKKENKELIAELENPEFLNSKEREDEWDEKANELSDKLPRAVSFRITNGKVDLFDNQSYREKGFGKSIVQVSNSTIHRQTEKFEVGDNLQVDDGSRAMPAVVTKVNENGKILEAKQENGKIIISKGNIITLAPINDRLKINAKYDELVALENKKSTPNKDRLIELGINKKQINNIKTKKQIQFLYEREELSDKITLEEFEKLVKDAIEENNNDTGVNKLLTLSDYDLIEYNQAVKNLAQILPIRTEDNPNGIIEVTDVVDVLKNLKTKGEIAGRFISKAKTIYLATQDNRSIKGVEYHEAFHAIFRMLMPNSRVAKYLRSAESKYGTPTTEQLTELKNSSSDLNELNQSELKNLWLEERLADDFMEFSKDNNRIQESWLRRLFNKIRNFLKSIFGTDSNTQISNEKAITQLFQDIYNGEFKNSKERFPIQRDGAKLQDVNKLLKNNYQIELSNGTKIDKEGYLSHSISEAIINTTTNEIFNQLKKEGKNNISTIDIHKFIKNNIRERFNPLNEYNKQLLRTVDEDLSFKNFDKLQDIYDSLDNPDNYDIITQEVLDRLPLYNLPREVSTVQEQSDDNINELEDSENDYGDGDNNGVIGKKTNEINHAWEKASKKVKQYISSTSIKTDILNIGKPFLDFIEQAEKDGNSSLVKNYEFAIRGSYLYSNLIKMLVNTPSYKTIGMMYSMSDMSEEMKYFTQSWFKDIYEDLKGISNNVLNIPEVNTSSMEDLYNTLKQLSYNTLNKSEHFSFITSDLEKNRIFLWDVLYDETGITQMLNANGREVAKQVFNRWNKNWESKRVDDLVSFNRVIDNYNNIYRSDTDNLLDNYISILNSNRSAEDKAKGIQELTNRFRKEFNSLGIDLPLSYIKHSLINHVVKLNQSQLLTNQQLDWYSNFSSSDINPITKDTLLGIHNALLEAKKFETFTIYNDLNKNNEKIAELGAVGRLKDIAESVGMFDPTVIPSSFNNQEGKRIYDIVPPSDISRRLNILKDLDNVTLLKDYIRTKDASDFKDKVLNNDIRNTYYFYSFFTNEAQVDNFLQIIDNNPLFKISQDDKYLDTLFSTLNISYAGGIRQIVADVNRVENENEEDDVNISSKKYGLFSDSDGKSYSNTDTTSKILYQLSLLADNELNQFNVKTINGQKFVYYKFTQPESKSTVPIVLMPYNDLIKEGKYTQSAKDLLFTVFQQEYDRIGKIQKEIDEFTQGIKKDGYNENYHYKNQNIEGLGEVKVFKNSEDKFFYLDIMNNNNPVELTEDQLLNVNTSKLNPRGTQFFNFLNNESGASSFIEKARKGEVLTDSEENQIKESLVKFFNTQFNEYINLLKQSDIAIIKDKEGKEVSNLLPKGFQKENSNELDRNKLLNAFLNDYLMSYSLNSLIYGDNANVSKDSIDWVKRAGGIIGSGNNYGSGESNVILIKSEERNNIDTTDAQTFSNPFWNLTTILRNKGAYDERIISIYKKIDSGLEYPTAEEYQYLYDNQAQHQPNKTQGYGFEHYLKTSISPLLRSETSRLKYYSKENVERALQMHDALFEFRLQNHDILFNPKFKGSEEVAMYDNLLKEYQNLFEAIPGQEYKYNLLNISEQYNALLVYDSAWKRSKVNVHSIRDGKPYLYKVQNEDGSVRDIIEPNRISNSTMVDQQKTDGVKSTIIHGTQGQRLITTEQDRDAITYFKDKKVDIGNVLDAYEKIQAQRIENGYNKLRKEIIDNNGDEKWETLLDSFIKSIQSSSSDPQLLELFQIGEDGKPKYNLNNPAIEAKFQAMFLSFISNGTLKQKTAGSKFTLMSEIGFELLRELGDDGKTIVKTLTVKEAKRVKDTTKYIKSRLRHDVYDEAKEEYYSEIVVSERFLKKFGYTKDQFDKGEIPQEFLYLQGVRIPTEDKHSMINAKIVDILPDSYGNVIMMPYEIVNLSGADFDIDSLYTRAMQTYTNILNKKTEIYGTYLSKSTIEEAKEQAYNEYLASMYEDKKISLTFNQLKNENKELDTLNRDKNIVENTIKEIRSSGNINTKELLLKPSVDELVKIKNEIKSLELELLKHAFEISDVTFDKEEWINKNKDKIESNYKNYNSEQSSDLQNIIPLTKGEINNTLLELERKLTNNTGNNKIANTPTSLDIFKNLVKILENDGLIQRNLGYGVHDILSKTLADMAISTGAANIGPAALFNNLFGLLIKHNVSLKNPLIISNEFSLYSRDRNNNIVNDNPHRVQDTLASVLAVMTDNAKEQLADLFNLSISSLPVALTMIATGNNFDNVMLLMKSPIVKKISELSSEYNKTIKSTEDYNDSKREKLEISEKINKLFNLENVQSFDGELNYENLLESLKYEIKPEMDNNLINYEKELKELENEDNNVSLLDEFIETLEKECN